MFPETVGEVFAERALGLENTDGSEKQEIVVRFGVPVHLSDSAGEECWACPVDVQGWPGGAFFCIEGQDSLQAVVLALIYCDRALPLEASKLGKIVKLDGHGGNPIFGVSRIA